MASQLSPGIVVQERDFTNTRLQETITNIGAIAGPFTKGEVGVAKLITNEKELVDTFGKPTNDNYEWWFTASEFLNYGGNLQVARISASNAAYLTNANSTGAVASGVANIKVNNLGDYETNVETATPSYKFVAKTPGSWGNSLKVAVIDSGADQILTLQHPVTLAAGATLSGSTGATGKVFATVSGSTEVSVILDGPERFTTSDTLPRNANAVATISGTTLASTSRTPGTYTSVLATGGSGSGARFNVTVATFGLIQGVANVSSADPNRVGGTYTNVPATGGSGTGARFNVVVDSNGAATVTILESGTGYTDNDLLTIPNASLGGGAGAANLTFNVNGVSAPSSPQVTLADGGSGYQVGNVLTISDALLGNGGAQAVTVTVASVATSTNAITAQVNWYDEQYAIPGLIKWNSIAPRPGTSPFAAQSGGSRDEMHIVVIDEDGGITGTSSTIIEKILFVSKASDARTTEGEANFYKRVVKGRSNYIYVGAHETSYDYAVEGVNISDVGLSSQTFKLLGPKTYSFAAGSDYQNYNVGNETQTYLDVFSDTETLNIDFILCGPSTASKANSLINLANTRKDCVAFVSPRRSDVIGSDASTTTAQKSNVVEFFEGISDSSSYAFFDNNYKYIYDRFNDTYRWIPCNADTAGLLVNTATIAEPWYSPAGFNRGNLRNAVKIAFNPNKAQRDELYAKRVNPIVAFPGQGIVLFGDKTALRSPSAFDRINVRRLFLILERTIKDFSKNVLFELNDETTRSNFTSQVEAYLRDVQARRGVTDFLVVADASNNTAEVIDRNEFVADIYLKPSRSINFITLTFVATRTGVSFDEVVGRV